jgi:hypothetical protein
MEFSRDISQNTQSTTRLEDLLQMKKQQPHFPTQNPYDLPPSHYPKDIEQLTSDPYAIPSYIPPHNEDFISQQAYQNDRQNLQYLQRQNFKNGIFNIYQQLANKIAILSLFFFAFQMNTVNNFIISNLSFVELTDANGTFNNYGMAIKSIIFATLYSAYNYLFANNEPQL